MILAIQAGTVNESSISPTRIGRFIAELNFAPYYIRVAYRSADRGEHASVLLEDTI